MLTKISAGARITSSMATRTAIGTRSRQPQRQPAAARPGGAAFWGSLPRAMTACPAGQFVAVSRVRHGGVGDVGALVLGEGDDDPEDQHRQGDEDRRDDGELDR